MTDVLIPVVVLGLDMGGKFGFAVGSNGKIIECGTIDVARKAAQLRCSNVTAVWQFLREKIDEHKVTAVCREDSIATFKQSSLKSKDSRKLDLSQALIAHARYAGIIELVVDLKKIRTINPVHPQTLKSFAGVGRPGGEDRNARKKAGKDAMVRSANRFYGLELGPDDDNAADAAHVCTWAMHQIKIGAVMLTPQAGAV